MSSTFFLWPYCLTHLFIIIGDLVTQFGVEGSRRNLVPLLEVLIALPEELNSRQLRLGQNRREQMNNYCKDQVPKLIQLLVSLPADIFIFMLLIY